VTVDARGFIPVTNVAGIYALGNVKGGPAFTHISYDDYRIIRNNLLRGGHSTTAPPRQAAMAWAEGSES
jgi:pyruvate/2-oxoglutarate dehydrogenase complex dihydrolipoamide dehydrogenase (E3) component